MENRAIEFCKLLIGSRELVFGELGSLRGLLLGLLKRLLGLLRIDGSCGVLGLSFSSNCFPWKNIKGEPNILFSLLEIDDEISGIRAIIIASKPLSTV